MKRFYRCPICGSEFCLKGRKYCEEGGNMICAGQSGKDHPKTVMDCAGDTIKDLRSLRRKHKSEAKL